MTTSPRPVPTAVPPASANGTSLPSRAPSAIRSAWDRPQPHSASQASSAAAASAEPPAMPPATGICLRSTRSTPARGRSACSRSSSAARTARLVSSSGTTRGTVDPHRDVGAGRRGGGDLVGQVDRLVERGQVVEAVGAHRSDGEVQVDLGGRDGRCTGHRASASGDPGEVVDRELLAPRTRVDAGGAQCGLGGGGRPGQPGERRAQHLAPLRERRVDHGEDRLPAGAGPGAVVALPGDEPGVDVRRRPEHRAADPARGGGGAVPGRLDAGHAVGARPRAGRPAGPPPRPAPSPVRSARVGNTAHRCSSTGHGDVVRQVGDHRRGRGAGDVGQLHRVGLHHRQPVGLVGGALGDGRPAAPRPTGRRPRPPPPARWARSRRGARG